MTLPIDLPDFPWRPRRRVWPLRLVSAIVLCMLAVAAAPSLVGAGEQRSVTLDNGVVMHVPARWRPRYGPLGEREFATAGGMVVITADPVPSNHISDAKRWYEANRLSALRPSGRANGLHETPADDADSAVYVPVSYTHLTLPTICSV